MSEAGDMFKALFDVVPWWFWLLFVAMLGFQIWAFMGPCGQDAADAPAWCFWLRG